MKPEQRKLVLYRFLSDRDALGHWKQNVENNTDSMWQSAESAFEDNNHQNCIGNVFGWTQTPQGSKYWEGLYNEWHRMFV